MFKTPYIQIDESGIDLIKNYSVFKHIDYTDVDMLEIRKGHLIKNWFFTFCIGLLVSIISLIWGMSLIDGFDFGAETRHSKIYMATIFSSIILFVGGIILIIQSFKRCENLILTIRDKNYEIPLAELEKENRINDLNRYLKSKVELIK